MKDEKQGAKDERSKTSSGQEDAKAQKEIKAETPEAVATEDKLQNLFQKQGRVIALLVVLLAIFLAIFLSSRGGGVPGGDVAVVEDVPDGRGNISKEQFEKTFAQSWKRVGLQAAPKEGSRQYESLLEATMNDLIDQAWLWGESQEFGVTVSEEEINQELKSLIKIQFRGRKNLFNQFKTTNGITDEDVKRRVELQLISQKMEQKVREEDKTLASFIRDYNKKWTARTTCAEGYEVPRCSNYSSKDTTKPPAITSNTGPPPKEVIIETIVPGKGKGATQGSEVKVDYVGALFESGSVFDSSWQSGRPLTTEIGAGQVIKGFDEGLIGIKEGERREIVIPARLGYGKKGSPPRIPPNSDLVFVVDALSVSFPGDN